MKRIQIGILGELSRFAIEKMKKNNRILMKQIWHDKPDLIRENLLNQNYQM